MLEKYDKKKNPFKVPDNYFEGLTEDIMSSLPMEKKQVEKKVLWKKTLPWIGVAAAVIAIYFAIGKPMGEMPKTVVEQTRKTISVQDKSYISYEDDEDYFLFLEEETTQALYVSVLFDE